MVDDSLGCLTGLLWRLQHRLSGAVVLYLRCFFDRTFLGSESHMKHVKNLETMSKLYETRSLAVENFINSVVYAPIREDMERAEEVFRGALSTAPASFYEFTSALLLWHREEIARMLEECSKKLLAQLPVELVCGVHSPVATCVRFLMQRVVLHSSAACGVARGQCDIAELE